MAGKGFESTLAADHADNFILLERFLDSQGGLTFFSSRNCHFLASIERFQRSMDFFKFKQQFFSCQLRG